MRTLGDVEPGSFDFLDFGAGTGNSTERCERLFGGRGLGIEINKKKIVEAAALDRNVVYGDIEALPDRKLVRFVSMDNFLEHLPDFDTARRMINVAGRVASDFIWIVHPSFDDEAYLRAIGLKQYWHDWSGHPSHLLLSDLVEMLRAAGARKLEIEYSGPTKDSSDPSILPIGAPRNQHDYDAARHGPKDIVEFARPVFRQIRIRAHLSDNASSEVYALQARIAELQDRKAMQLARMLGYIRRIRRPADVAYACRRLRTALATRSSRPAGDRRPFG